jgi:hypothetical protein
MRVNSMLRPIRYLSVALLVAIGWATGATGETNAPAGATNELPSVTATGLTAFSAEPLSIEMFGGRTPLTGPATPEGPRTIQELRQRLVRAMDAKDYTTALELANAGLVDSPWDVGLLTAKGIALAKLHRYRTAIATFKEALLTEPDNEELVTGVAELTLIAGEVRDFQTLKMQHASVIEGAYGGLLAKYFDVLEAYRTGDENQVRAAAVKLLTALPATGDSRLRNWEFEELLYVTGQQPASEKKTILLTVVQVLSGQMGRDEGLAAVRGKPEG